MNRLTQPAGRSRSDQEQNEQDLMLKKQVSHHIMTQTDLKYNSALRILETCGMLLFPALLLF